MRTLRAWLVRVIGFVRPWHGEQDFADELQSHIELHIADNVRAGMTPDEARRRAPARPGSVASVSEEHPDAGALPALASLIQGAGYAVRGRAATARSPWRAWPRSLGIGVNSASSAWSMRCCSRRYRTSGADAIWTAIKSAAGPTPCRARTRSTSSGP